MLDLLHGMDDLLTRSVGPMIEIKIEGGADLWQATVDPSQLELAVLNLTVNARDAMPAGGTMTVTLANETITGGAPHPAELPPGDYLRLTVADTGVGMDEETLARATEPFFTTKSDGRGHRAGPGVGPRPGVAVRRRAAADQPDRQRRPPPRYGCRGLPAMPRTWPVSGPAGGDPAPRKLKVLLVDDDGLIAMSTQAVLEDLGHTVRTAGSGKKALELLAADPAVDLVISDHAMPGMTGLELIQRIRAQWPRMPILLATGYDDSIGADRDLPRITKPYSQRGLAAAIRR